jgi:hypothetical protein
MFVRKLWHFWLRTRHFVEKSQDNSCCEQPVVQQGLWARELGNESLETFVLISVGGVAIKTLCDAQMSS